MGQGEIVSSVLLLLVLSIKLWDTISTLLERKKHMKDEKSRNNHMNEDKEMQRQQIDLLTEIVSKMNQHNYIAMQPWETLGFTEEEWNQLPEGEKVAITNTRDWVTIPSRIDGKLLVVGSHAPTEQVSLKEYTEGVK